MTGMSLMIDYRRQKIRGTFLRSAYIQYTIITFQTFTDKGVNNTTCYSAGVACTLPPFVPFCSIMYCFPASLGAVINNHL
jgi:hypothetical protein